MEIILLFILAVIAYDMKRRIDENEAELDRKLESDRVQRAEKEANSDGKYVPSKETEGTHHRRAISII